MDRRQRSFSLVISVLLLQALVWSVVHAQSQRVIEYEYDGAGNLIGISSELNTAPPDVTDISPRFIEINTTGGMVATGTNLSKVTVTTSTPGLTISDVQSENTRVRFTITAGDGAVPGRSMGSTEDRWREDRWGHIWSAPYCKDNFVCDKKNIAPNYPALG